MRRGRAAPRPDIQVIVEALILGEGEQWLWLSAAAKDGPEREPGERFLVAFEEDGVGRKLAIDERPEQDVEHSVAVVQLDANKHAVVAIAEVAHPPVLAAVGRRVRLERHAEVAFEEGEGAPGGLLEAVEVHRRLGAPSGSVMERLSPRGLPLLASSQRRMALR